MKPFIKWVGGKTKLLESIYKYFPPKIECYHEPFLGGGSVLLGLLEKIEKKEIEVSKIRVNDTNKILIELFKIIKNDHVSILNILDTYIEEYNKAPNMEFQKRKTPKNQTKETALKNGKIGLYYYYRDLYNKTDDLIQKCALFLFLNKTGFRGLYRESTNGFNVPFGNYKNLNFYDLDNIQKISALLNKYKVEFYNQDFKEFLSDINKEDFVYIDPPYYPINKKSFTKYQKNDFKDHENLYKICEKIPKFLHSNSNCQYNLDKYKKYDIQTINTKHSVNSKKPGKLVEEILIHNLSIH